jgi:hypothetical protein
VGARLRAADTVVAVGVGAVVGAWAVGAALSVGGCGERTRHGAAETRRKEAPSEEIAQWTGELERRALRWREFPDPPGRGAVTSERFRLGHEAYELELRLREGRVTAGVHGVDRQEFGGGWIAFAEGSFEPGSGVAERPFAGARVRLSWSCLGAKLRSGNDGVARLSFDATGERVLVEYLAYGEPGSWLRAEGRRRGDDAAAAERGRLTSMVPVTERMARLEAGATYRVKVRVVGPRDDRLGQALVRVKGHPETEVLTGTDGEAELAFPGGIAPVAQVVSAARLGYRNGETVCFADDAAPGWRAGALAVGVVVVRLEALDLADHAAYRWQHPAPDHDGDDLMACGTCHKWHYDQWQGSRHARAADNGHVAYELARRAVTAPDSPDDCRGCHQPAEAVEKPGGGWRASGVRAGVHCDLCHKVHAVGDLRESGTLGALRLARPDPEDRSRPGGIHRVFGPAPDVTYAYMGAAWNPLYAASHYCAACHQGGGRWREGAPFKLDTFEEWRAWAAAAPASEVRSCQECHMSAGTTKADDGRAIRQLAWDGLHREPSQVHEHRFEGSGAVFGAKALDVAVTTRREGSRLLVTARVTNVGAGHRVPTGTWSKHVLVGVWAHQQGRWLAQVEGDRAWTVAGEAPERALAAGEWENPGGLVLGVREASARSGALHQPDLWLAWRADELKDERLAPGEARMAACVFALDGAAPAEVVVRVVHRRGELGLGPAHTPWKPALYDEPPEVLWRELVVPEGGR